MPIYYVQQKATVWHEVSVDADTPQEALSIGMEIMNKYGGHEAEDSFEWADAFWLGDSEHNEIELHENE
jgi:hypothetical protein